MTGLRLCAEDIEAIARRVVELQREALEGQAPGDLLTPAEVARRFGVSRAWVYSRADELGAIRLGEGRKPRLRFEAERVAQALRTRSAGERSGGQGSAALRGFSGDVGRLAPEPLERLPERWRQAVAGGGTA